MSDVLIKTSCFCCSTTTSTTTTSTTTTTTTTTTTFHHSSQKCESVLHVILSLEQWTNSSILKGSNLRRVKLVNKVLVTQVLFFLSRRFLHHFHSANARQKLA